MISVLDMNQEFYSQTNEPPFSNTKRKTFRKVNGAPGGGEVKVWRRNEKEIVSYIVAN